MLDNVRSWSRDGDSKRLREAQENDGAEPLLEVPAPALAISGWTMAEAADTGMLNYWFLLWHEVEVMDEMEFNKVIEENVII